MSRTMKHCMRFILFPALLAAMLTTGLSFFVASTPVARAQSLDSSGTMSQAVQLDSPAVVRILSVVYGQLVCRGCDSNGNDVYSPQQSQNYFEWASSGSGVFVSPDGYILTADHVVDHSASNPGDLDYLLNSAANDIATRYNMTPDSALQILQNQYNQGNVGINIQVQSQKVFLSTTYTGQLQNTAQMISYPLTRVVASSAVDKQDTAIIQIEAHDMPFLNLASNSTINVGDTVTAIGYPADADCVVNNCDFTALLTPGQSDATTLSSLLDLSASSGQITSQKTQQDGTPVSIVGGEIASAGSSGGPVIDQQGNIIGFVDAAPSGNRITFVVPSSVIQSYIQQAGITNPHGNFMSLWTQALTDYNSSNACLRSQASANLTKLRTDYPQFGAVLPLLQNAPATSTTACAAPSSSNNMLLIAGMVAGIILVAGILIFLKRRKRNAPQLAPAPMLTPAPVSMPTPAPQASSSPSLVRLPSQPQYPPYAPQSPTGYGASAWNTGIDSQAVTMPPSQVTPVQSPTPVRQCSRGHLIYEREARFCPDCGSTVQDLFIHY